MSSITNAADLVDPVTARIRGIWTSGDFGRIAVGYAPGSAEFVARLSLLQGERVLDVACGTGNLAIPAARAGALATGVDIAPNLIEQAINNAARAEVAARFEVGDAECLPCADGSFDTTMTMFGAMFAARPDRAARELLRVTRIGGRIAMANWTPTGFVGQMLKIVVGYVPPPPGSISVLQWGDEKIVRERLADVQKINCIPRRITFNYPFSAAETVRLFRDWYGPTVHAFAALDEQGRESLERDLTTLWIDNNLAQDGLTRVESEYLEVIAIR
ncbi:MAG: class I SAM-dependent methyltransferase [Gemmatimonadaceae bacterium]